jgi:hypothetical protein
MHSKKRHSNKVQNFIQGLRPFSSTVPYGLKKKLKKGGYNFSEIVDNWTKLVGNTISSACYPCTIKMNSNMKEGTLILNVIHGNEVNIEYCKTEILDKINSFFGYQCIKEIKLKSTREEKNEKKLEQNKKTVMKSYKNELNNVKNNDLKNSLKELIKAFNDKNN